MDASNIQICKPDVKLVQVNVKLSSIKQPEYIYKYPINGDLVECPHCGEHCRSPGNTPCHGLEPFAALKKKYL
uniref:Uncharacterized protein n=1 Tax=viral metagenome TaxID=1070528 RepID=A0A6C0JUS4_9ZZZZ